MKNLIVTFCSVTPDQLSNEIKKRRIIEYQRSLDQLKRLTEKNFDMIRIDNTSYSINNSEFIHMEENKGNINKGIGEVAMLRFAIEKRCLENYEKVCYVTGRHLWICPYFFEKVLQMQSDILISNPNFMYINGKYHKVIDGLYNDMAFGMKKDIIKKYAAYVDFSQERKSSEHWLYDFVHNHNYSYEQIEHLGLIRNDWAATGNYIDLNNYHGV